MSPDLLDVVAVYDNPMRWRSRLRNFQRFEAGMLEAGVRLTTVELAHGDRSFELTEWPRINRVKLRANDVLWRKENLSRIGAELLPDDARYVMFADGDMEFRTLTWPADVLHALQMHRMVQVSTNLIWLGPDDGFVGHAHSLMYWYELSRRRHREGKFWDPGPVEMVDMGYPGGMWAFRREAYEAMGGLLDICPLGAADYHSIYALLALPDLLLNDNDYTQAYRDSLKAWGQQASAVISESDIGSVPGLVFHFWHGPLAARRYSTREQILIRNHFDPTTDLVRRRDGLLELAGNKPKLAGDIYSYFAERNEDSNQL